jgi:hypothetical protein
MAKTAGKSVAKNGVESVMAVGRFDRKSIEQKCARERKSCLRGGQIAI